MLKENVFYVIQPMPGDAPWHLKLGFSEHVAGRLASYQTLCPDARILKTWPCLSMSVEAAAIAYAEKAGFERIGSEVFSCLHPDRLVACLDIFFEVTPAQGDLSPGTPNATWRSFMQNQPVDDDTLLPRPAVAKRLGITVGALEKLLRAGEMPAYPITRDADWSHGRIGVRAGDVAAFLARLEE